MWYAWESAKDNDLLDIRLYLMCESHSSSLSKTEHGVTERTTLKEVFSASYTCCTISFLKMMLRTHINFFSITIRKMHSRNPHTPIPVKRPLPPSRDVMHLLSEGSSYSTSSLQWTKWNLRLLTDQEGQRVSVALSLAFVYYLCYIKKIISLSGPTKVK